MRQTGHRGKVDLNQPELVAQLRKAGVQVQLLSTVGQGCPDLLCGWRNLNILLEVKQEGCTLNKQEQEWHETWPGQVAVIHNFSEAMDAILSAWKAREAA